MTPMDVASISEEQGEDESDPRAARGGIALVAALAGAIAHARCLPVTAFAQPLLMARLRAHPSIRPSYNPGF
jgi:hypothetical protein